MNSNRVRAVLRSRGETPLVFAHRGASAVAPENTIEAAVRGHATGAVGWELDVRLTRDGVAVVIHDASLLRTTDVARVFASDPRVREGALVAAFDFAEIRTLDAGSWFVSPTGGPRSASRFGTLSTLDANDRARFSTGKVRVPTLSECLEFTAAHDWLVNVEIKTWPDPEPRLVPVVLDEIRRLKVADRVLISSFDHADVARVVRANQGVATGVLTSQPLYQPARYVRELVGADCYHPASDAIRIEELQELRAAEVPVLCFTVNDARPDGLAARLSRAGVSAFFSDDPAALLRLFAGG